MFCWFFKLMISHAADGDNNPSGRMQKHIRHCAACREFSKICQSLGEGLRREAAISNTDVSKRLSKRIFNAVTIRQTKTYKVGTRWRFALAAACIALIVIIGALFVASRRDNQGGSQPYENQMADAIQELRAAYGLAGKDLPAAWPGVLEGAMAIEFESLANDTESAARFLFACVAVDISDVQTNQ